MQARRAPEQAHDGGRRTAEPQPRPQRGGHARARRRGRARRARARPRTGRGAGCNQRPRQDGRRGEAVRCVRSGADKHMWHIRHSKACMQLHMRGSALCMAWTDPAGGPHKGPPGSTHASVKLVTVQPSSALLRGRWALLPATVLPSGLTRAKHNTRCQLDMRASAGVHGGAGQAAHEHGEGVRKACGRPFSL